MFRDARILCVGAHPDDVEYGCLGTLIKYGADDRVRVVVLTAGEFGDSGRDRTAETRAAFACCGFHDVHVLGFPDGNLYGNILTTRQTVGAIDSQIAEFRPTVVLFNSAADTHQDHRTTEAVVRASLRGLPMCRITYQGPSTTRDFVPSLFVGIDDQWDRKVAALAKHESQAARKYMQMDALAAAHTDRRAVMIGAGKFVELFHIIEAWL